jgi:hypothetical protein
VEASRLERLQAAERKKIIADRAQQRNDRRDGRASAHDDSLLSNQEADAVVEQDTEDDDGEDNAEDVDEDGVAIQPEPRTMRSA